jgi:transposase-like protein
MESMGKKPRRRRSFTPEFKAEIVQLCQQGDRSVGQVAKDFDLTEIAVREWVKQAERDAGTGRSRDRRTDIRPPTPVTTSPFLLAEPVRASTAGWVAAGDHDSGGTALFAGGDGEMELPAA